MRRDHLERLRPICPTCRAAGRPAAPLALTSVARVDESDDVREGVLLCQAPMCQREHPIVDGIPIVVSDIASWAAHQLDPLLWRSDLSPLIESLLGDAAGPGHPFERERSLLSAYGQTHWGDLDQDNPSPRSETLVGLLEVALDLLDSSGAGGGAWLDLGCAAGRATRELAVRGAELAVGVDLSFALLRVAERTRRERRAVFPLRRVGLVYDHRDIGVPEMPAERMSFWCCDVDNLPFPDAAFDGGLSLNVLDCVPSPVQHLLELGRVLTSGAPALVATPYDWSATATPVAQWLGGHSQRGEAHGSSAAELRRVLASVDSGLEIELERDRVAWRVYVNERASMDYAVHLLRLRRRDR